MRRCAGIQELYKGEDFFCQVIDEAQYIKNAGTKGARAVKSVSAQMKLASRERRWRTV